MGLYNLINTHARATHSCIKKTNFGDFPLTLAVSTCGELGSEVHAVIQELVRGSTNYNLKSEQSQILADGTEIARLGRRFCLVLQQALSFRT